MITKEETLSQLIKNYQISLFPINLKSIINNLFYILFISNYDDE